MAAADFSTSLGLDASVQGLDVSRVDANLKAARAVEMGWRLPELPELVKLDLASVPGVTPESVSALLQGLDRDFHGEADDDEDDVITQQSTPYRVNFNDPRERSGFDQFRVAFSDLANNPRPTETSVDAVKQWKIEAARKGYLKLEQGQRIDNTWDPSYNSIRYEMMRADMDDAYRGDRFGALPLFGEDNPDGTHKMGALEHLAKWTAPSGLLGAAVDLDLFWDVGAIGKEFTSWSDKWRKLGESKNPWDFAKNFIDAATGPIDDILVPALNMWLLASGVGAAMNFGRVAMLGEKAMMGGRIFDSLYDSVKVAQGVSRMGEASSLALRLQRGGSTAAGIGKKLEQWRALSGVKATKGVVQQGMKLGLASQAEDLLPGYQGGFAIGDFDPIANARDRFTKSPLVWGVGEALFTPYSVFSPGSFTGVAKSFGGFGAKALGSAPGRAAVGAVIGAGVGTATGEDTSDIFTGMAAGAGLAAGAPVIGKGLSAASSIPGLSATRAAKVVGFAGDFLQKTSFAPIAKDQRITKVMHESLLDSLQGDDLIRYQEAFQREGFVGALKNVYGVDEEAAGAAISYAMLAASADYTATMQAKALGEKGFKSRYHLNRNKLINQIRGIDMDAVSEGKFEQMAYLMAKRDAGSNFGVGKRYRKILGQLQSDPERAMELANMHNNQAHDTLRQMLSVENMPDFDPAMGNAWAQLDPEGKLGVMRTYLPKVWDTFGNWPRFTERYTDIRHMTEDGLLDEVEYLTAKGVHGRGMKILSEFETVPTAPRAHMWTDSIDDHMLDKVDINDYAARGYMAPLARSVQSQGATTLAKADTITKQELLEAVAKMRDLTDNYRAFTGIPIKARKAGNITESGAKLLGKIGDAGTELGSMTRARLTEIASAAGLTSGETEFLKKMNGFAGRHGLSSSDLRLEMERVIDDMVGDQTLLERFGLGTVVTGKDGRVLKGHEALAHYAKELQERSKFTAAELDVDGLIRKMDDSGRVNDAAKLRSYKTQLERDGYKLVHGVEYLTPHDLMGATPIFKDISTRHMNAVSLGNFFRGRMPEVARMEQTRRRYTALASELSQIDGHGLDLSDESQDMKDILSRAQGLLYRKQETSEMLLEEVRNETIGRKLSARWHSSTTPTRVEDLGLGVNYADVVEEFGAVYSPEVAKAVWRALKKSRNAEFKDLGLAAVEAKLRNRSQLVDALTVLSATGLVSGAAVGAATSDDPFSGALKGAAIGGAAGLAGQVGFKGTLRKAGEAFDQSRWSRYGYMADNYARLRDQLRFTMSPWFDITRYSEAGMLGQIGVPSHVNGKRVILPYNIAPSRLEKQLDKYDLSHLKIPPELREKGGKGVVDHLKSEYARAARGQFNPDAADGAVNFFRQVGIMGFSPLDYERSVFSHLRAQGVETKQAFEAAREAFSYGLKGRSPAELSVNTIFFPFSFAFKTAKHTAQWIGDDFTRSVIIHDGLRLHQLLDEKYDLDSLWRDHLPALEKLQQLNPWAYGLSLGQMGGINRRAFDFGWKATMSLFTPQGFSIKNAADAEMVTGLAKALMPAINDIQHLAEDLKEQGHVLFSPTHQTRAAEARDGYGEWNEYKRAVSQQLSDHGYTFADLQRNPSLTEAKMAYNAKRAELGEKFPGWLESQKRAIVNKTALDMEKRDALARAATGKGTVTDQMLFEYEQQVDAVKAYMDQYGIEDWQDLDPETWDALHGMAIQFAERNPQWKWIYNRFYRSQFGPIERTI
ncbi:MAG TPA: hypothetical protein VJQ57_09255 [Acidimicrobiia bacterium]|nr:hypothetical protein [Acidimicrobiia bacterium]